MIILAEDNSESIRSLIDFSLSEIPETECPLALDEAYAISKFHALKPKLVVSDVIKPHMYEMKSTSTCIHDVDAVCPDIILTTEAASIRECAVANSLSDKLFATEKFESKVQRFLKS